jgi:hypothetical protein
MTAGGRLAYVGPYSRVSLDVAGEGVCSVCQRTLPVSEFSPRPDTTRRYDYSCKECVRWDRLLKTYSLTRAEYESIWEAQGCGCAVCGAIPSGAHGAVGQAHVDHDHSCCPGAKSCGYCIRGILCWSCNTQLISGYERLPAHCQTWDRVNEYLTRRPISRLSPRPSRFRGRRMAGTSSWESTTNHLVVAV